MKGLTVAHMKFSLGAAAGCALLAGGPVWADVTANDVWSNWQEYMTGSGVIVSAEETADGANVLLKKLSLAIDIPEEDGTVTVEIPQIDFLDRGDGTVTVVYPAQMDITVLVNADTDDAATAVIAMESQGMSIVASGEPNDITYSFSAASLGVSLADLQVEGEDIPDLTAAIMMNDLNGRSNIAIGDLFSVSESFNAASMSVDFRFVDPDNGENVVINGSSQDVAFEVAAIVPIDVDPEDPKALFDGGFALEAHFERGSSEGVVSGTDDDGPFSIQTQNGAGSADVVLNGDVFSVSGAALDNSFTMIGGGIPFPLSGQIGESSISLEMPLSAAEAPQDFGFGLSFVDVSIPDLLWNIFDPSAILERAPATLALDLVGQTRVFTDLFDPSIADSDDFPGELNSLSLNNLELSVAGAELTGSGDFTFDNADLESFEGFPRPQGAADFRLLGGNMLLDSLIEMGLVGEDDAIAARLMMGLFTVAGPSEDELNSRLEVNEAGHVLANGQRLR